jgi:hypothetical protein
MPRALAMHAGITTALAVFFVLVWAVTGHGYFWPIWPIIGLGIVFLLHAAVAFTQREERIAVLEETRAGAVDLQESELRRIERDLHDGAQARLVALGMTLGMAEQKLTSDPAAAQELLAEVRRGTYEALEELRSLARGIHPPVLADRGLDAAVSALAEERRFRSRSPSTSRGASRPPSRPPRTSWSRKRSQTPESMRTRAGSASISIPRRTRFAWRSSTTEPAVLIRRAAAFAGSPAASRRSTGGSRSSAPPAARRRSGR